MKFVFRFILLVFCQLLFLHLYSQGNNNKDDALVAKACATIKQKADVIRAWINAHKGTKPAIPTPPVIDPDCHDCKDKNPSNESQKEIDAFAKKANEPEAGMIKTILAIARQKALLGEGGNILPGDNMPYNGKYSCLNNPSDAELKKMFEFLEKREWEKASGMIMKYKNNGDYFIGGIRYYLDVLRSLTLTGYLLNNTDIPPEVLSWIIKYYVKYQDRFFHQYQYQLFTPLFYLPRQVALLGGIVEGSGHKLVKVNGNYELQDYNPVIEMFKKAIGFMHFHLKITYTGEGNGASGDHEQVKMTGEANLQCERIINDDGSDCFEWKATNGLMQFNVDEAWFTGHDKEKIDYESPKKFSVPVNFNVNMCDKDPVFRMYFDALWPKEEHYNHNQAGELDKPLLYTLISATLGSINKGNIMKYVDKMQQDMPDEKEMEAWNERMEAHGNDPAYFKTPQGKKDLATARQLKKKYGSISPDEQKNVNAMKDAMKNKDYDKIKSNSRKLLKSEQEMTGGALTLNKLELPFKIGNAMAVDGSLSSEASNEGYKGVFKITLQNTPQKK